MGRRPVIGDAVADLDGAGLGDAAGGAALRSYDSSRRRAAAAETRERIVAAGVELLRATSIRDWGALTIRAVAERAEVNERTVYRHLGGEKGLRDAVMQRLEVDAGIELEGLRLADVTKVATRIFEHVSAYPVHPVPLDPTLGEASRRQHEALLAAVGEHWDGADREVAAGVLDVLWGVDPYQRLVAEWGLAPEEAVRGITWVLGLVETAIREGHRP